jgi:predicted flap endonuclease-1-like 5' DNA nuclease
MWAALIGVAVFGLLLGWAIRGMLLVGKMRRAMVERDVTQTELEQAKEEIESLYAAQRGQPVGNPNAREAQAEQTVKIQRLTDDLARAKSELEALKAKASEAVAAGAGAAGAASTGTLAAVGGATDPNPALVWRNRHLESRVRHLESLVSDGASAAPAEQVAQVETAIPAVAASDAETAKADWQQNFLKQRVEALEAELARMKVPASAPAARQGHGEADEELARLRWRNRFLEGRLAYFEGDSDAEAEAGAAGADDADAAPLMGTSEPEIEESVEAAPEPIAEPATEVEPEPMADPTEIGLHAEAVEEEVPAEVDAATPEPEADLDLPDAEAAEEADEEVSLEQAFAGVPPVDDADDRQEAPIEMAADPDAEVDVPAFEIVDRFADDAPSEPVEADEADAVELSGAAVEEDDSEEAGEPPVASAEEASRAILAALELNDDESPEAEAVADEDDADMADDAFDEAEEESDAEDMPPQAVGVRPLALDKPVENSPDDLTEIGGIGPKIQELLNEMGIWHYDQIAAWSPENVAWVDQELHFSGRIAREGWVQQAAVLAGDTVEGDVV